uniref:Mitochondrial assembly of ribosomal large subunit protein 1 n=1 Tax=Daphnia atkinsoni TaxID=342845 RepID=A0A4Y7M1X7_9CRUS|nr:EOG090X0AI9 [Daphnia atkinsoni]
MSLISFLSDYTSNDIFERYGSLSLAISKWCSTKVTSADLQRLKEIVLNFKRKYSEELAGSKSEETIEEFDEFQGISLQHGTTGIFDIEEFVEILGQQKLQNIVVIAVPSQLNYVDYMVITTGRSPKQMTAFAEFIRKISKRRCSESDPLPVIEGKSNKDWIALDLGNIALHIFSSKFRKIYDLETLWTCGPDFDDLSKESDILTGQVKSYAFPSQK